MTHYQLTRFKKDITSTDNKLNLVDVTLILLDELIEMKAYQEKLNSKIGDQQMADSLSRDCRWQQNRW